MEALRRHKPVLASLLLRTLRTVPTVPKGMSPSAEVHRTSTPGFICTGTHGSALPPRTSHQKSDNIRVHVYSDHYSDVSGPEKHAVKSESSTPAGFMWSELP
jgi:hypothetical protein